MSLPEAVKQLRGEPDSKVTVTIQRPFSSGLVKDFTLTRAIIKTDMVKDINGKKEFPLATTKSATSASRNSATKPAKNSKPP